METDSTELCGLHPWLKGHGSSEKHSWSLERTKAGRKAGWEQCSSMVVLRKSLIGDPRTKI